MAGCFRGPVRKGKEMAKKKKSSVLQVAVASRVKEVIKKAGLRSDGKLADAVNVKLIEILQNAAVRCKANRRSTVRGHDL